MRTLYILHSFLNLKQEIIVRTYQCSIHIFDSVCIYGITKQNTKY